MNRFLCLALLFVSQLSWAGEGVRTVQLENKRVDGISEVRLLVTGQLLIRYSFGQTNGTKHSSNTIQSLLLTEDQLTDQFLESWGIQRKQARLFYERFQQEELLKAISDGLFRQIDDTVYDLRKPQPDWIHFNNVKVVKTLKSHAVINIAPDTSGTSSLIYVRNFPVLPTGQDRVSFVAFRCKQTISNSPETLGHVFDCGKLCGRADIPALMLKEKRSSMKVEKGKVPQ